MNLSEIPDNPYLLLTPGPLSTSKSVRGAMLRDWCTWDQDYKDLVQKIRRELVKLATENFSEYTSVLMQGSGTFCLESVINSMSTADTKLLVLVNGTYGARIAKIARKLNIEVRVSDSGATNPPNLSEVEKILQNDTTISHLVVVHCETTTGILNPLEPISKLANKYNKTFVVDAMSSFGAVKMDINDLGIDFLISSANKCIQGVPGFGFIIARTEEIKKCCGQSTSVALDLYDQWKVMEEKKGKWRYTSPTHVVRAFYQALQELGEEGVITRQQRYRENQQTLVRGMKKLGFKSVIDAKYQSPIITTFYNPKEEEYNFDKFYHLLKEKGFVIYPGKLMDMDTFRIGSIGAVTPADMKKLVDTIAEIKFW